VFTCCPWSSFYRVAISARVSECTEWPAALLSSADLLHHYIRLFFPRPFPHTLLVVAIATIATASCAAPLLEITIITTRPHCSKDVTFAFPLAVAATGAAHSSFHKHGLEANGPAALQYIRRIVQ
jgi:hypothetical protein